MSNTYEYPIEAIEKLNAEYEALKAKVTNVLLEVAFERSLQERKWGTQNHTPAEWLMILGEEVGECNKAALEFHFAYPNCNDLVEYRAELIQVAAVAVAAIESLDRNGLPQRCSTYSASTK